MNFSSEMSQEKRSGLEIISSFIRITWDKSNIKRVIISGIKGFSATIREFQDVPSSEKRSGAKSLIAILSCLINFSFEKKMQKVRNQNKA